MADDLHDLHSKLVDQIIGLLELSNTQSNNYSLKYAVFDLIINKCVEVRDAIATARPGTETLEDMEEAVLIIKQYLEINRL